MKRISPVQDQKENHSNDCEQLARPQAIHVFLEMQGIELLQGDVWCHRKDLDEYFTI
jgi:hypothetical protein